jgi:transglutaminase-like putative cysteine protease
MRLTLCAMVASIATSGVLISVVRGDQWFYRCAGAIALIAVTGAVGRAARLARPLVFVAQGIVIFGYCTALYAPGPSLLGFIPHRKDAWDLHYDVLSAGFNEIGSLTPPIVTSPGVEFIIVAGVAIMAGLVDALAASYRQAALAGLPLLVLYTIPAAVLPNGISGWYFLLPAAGYLLLLLVESRDRMLRWGIPLASRAPGPTGGRAAADLNRMSRRIGLAVLLLAVLIPTVSPLPEGSFGGEGVTGKPGGKTISTLNPLVTLRRDLVRPDEFPVMTMTTNSSTPTEQYLRTVTLDDFNGEEWKAGRRQVQKFEELLPPPPGLSLSLQSSSIKTQIAISDRLASDYLPMPYPATRVLVQGAWRVDPNTGNVVSHKGRQQITGTTYSVESLELVPQKADVVEDTPTSPYLQPYLALPNNMPAKVRSLARDITKNADGVLEKGLALQSWFRKPGNFTYDLSVRPGGGRSSILDFLSDKRGYCEQFASTMAVMARMLDIPARVNVGFTAGRLTADGSTRRITSHDAHAWPELYLAGIGWTRFEPTPGSAGSNPSVPSWLGQNEKPEPVEKAEDPKPDVKPTSPADSPTSSPSRPDCAGADADTKACRDPDTGAAAVPSSTTDSGFPVPGLAFGLALLVLLAAAPGLLRLWIRWRRWTVASAGGPAAAAAGTGGPGMAGAGAAGAGTGGKLVAETAWRELRDSSIDLGYAWPDARTPRQTAAALAGDGRLSHAGAEALATIMRTVERVRYAPGGGPDIDRNLLRGAVDDVRRELALNADTSNRLRARLAPRSLRFVGRAGMVRLRGWDTAARRGVRHSFAKVRPGAR